MKGIQKEIKPFLRWAGGKRWLANFITSLIPNDINDYYEPFLGAGNVFFKMNGLGKKHYLSDTNKDLILTYCQIKDNYKEVIKHLRQFENKKKYYNTIRNKKFRNPNKTAAKFIYLNKTCFNGIYRVNRKGEFNVPYGYKKRVDFINEGNLQLVSKYLHKAEINQIDFEKATLNCKEKDFIYFDPPYTVSHSKNGFISYNSKLFSWDDQIRLFKRFNELSEKGCYALLSNANHTNIRRMYKEYEFIYKKRTSVIAGSVENRKKVREILIKNF